MSDNLIHFPAARIVRAPADREGQANTSRSALSEERLRALAERLVDAMRAHEGKA